MKFKCITHSNQKPRFFISLIAAMCLGTSASAQAFDRHEFEASVLEMQKTLPAKISKNLTWNHVLYNRDENTTRFIYTVNFPRQELLNKKNGFHSLDTDRTCSNKLLRPVLDAGGKIIVGYISADAKDLAFINILTKTDCQPNSKKAMKI